jgi:hypothetical protein
MSSQIESENASRPSAGANATLAAGTLKIDDDWRRWIVENLLLDIRRENLLHTMIAKGIARQEANREIDLALNSPYMKGVNHLRDRLKKRDWLLATYRKLNRMRPKSAEIERRHQLSHEEFFTDYYIANRPVIITGMIDDWPALQKWSLDYFAARFGGREIEVQFGRSENDDYEVDREKYIRKITVAEYVERVRSVGATNDFYLTANNNAYNKTVVPELWDDIIQIPEYLDARDRLAGFFWMGPAGTITPFHHDLTNNFMAQVLGRKRVKLAPSWDMPLMANHRHVYSAIDGRKTLFTPRPAPREAQILECVLNPGEVLFLPIGCMHFVEALEISVTMSFTNFLYDNDFSSSYPASSGM